MESTLAFGSPEFFVALLHIIWINLLLSGDNSIVIALACRNLPDRQRKQGVFWGVMAAVVLRIIFTVFAMTLLQIPFLKTIGGLLLLWIGVQLMLPQDETHEIEGKDRLFDAVRTIVFADLAMSIDNVLGVAAAAKGDTLLIIIGLCLSVPLVVWGSNVVLRLISRFPWIVVAGAALLGHVAGGMIQSDPATTSYWATLFGEEEHALGWFGLALVVIIGKVLAARIERANKAAQEERQEAGSGTETALGRSSD